MTKAKRSWNDGPITNSPKDRTALLENANFGTGKIGKTNTDYRKSFPGLRKTAWVGCAYGVKHPAPPAKIPRFAGNRLGRVWIRGQRSRIPAKSFQTWGLS
jgi:hypothetical protein